MRRITAMIMSLILLFSLAVSVSAAAASPFLMQEYDVTQEWVLFYGKRLPEDGAMEVSVGSHLIQDGMFSTLDDQDIPVTIYCLVDCATTVNDSNIKKRRDILLTISSLMSPEDSMILATIDSKLTESKPLIDKEIRDNAIRTISGHTWNTNLLDGINKSLENLRTSTAYNTNRCLVVISDGHDDGNSTATKNDILDQIEKSGIPVYTILLDTQSTTDKDIQRYQQFSDASLGGFMTNPDKEKISSTVAGEKVWDSIKGATTVIISAAELAAAGTDPLVLFRYTTEEVRYEDTVLVHSVDLPTAPAVSTDTPPEDTADTTEETKDKEKDKDDGSSDLMLICIVGAILLAAGAAAFFLLRKKPEEVSPDVSSPEAASPSGYTGTETDFFPAQTDFNPGADSFVPPFFDDPMNDSGSVTMPVENRCHVTAVALMHPEITADFYLTPNMETTFGRNTKADIVLNSSDKKLSSCHGCFFWDGKMLLVQDRNSTNGTAVNGQLCTRNTWLRLDDGHTLTAGSFEYRVSFRKDI